VSVEWGEITARRLARSWLAPRGDDLVETVRDACGVHAQVQASAELQVAARVDGIARSDVLDALWRRRTLAKAWTIRGTLHVHPSDELALWLAAKRAVDTGDGSLPEWRDPNGGVHPPLTAKEAAAVRALVWEALDGRCLRRDELVETVVRQVGPKPRARLASGFAFFLGDLCQGPPQGSRVTLARPDQWIEGWRDLEPHEALREVCRRFLRAYGPAHPAAFREWFGAREPQALFEAVGEDLGDGLYVERGDRSFPALERCVRLLPEYDAYVMGFRERDVLVPERVRALVTAHGRGRYEGPAGVRFVLVDGVAAGLWERTRRGRRIELRLTLARRVRRAALVEEAARIGSFLGLEPELV
jgi:hypothetical protein